jgi:hypothetical protein
MNLKRRIVSVLTLLSIASIQPMSVCASEAQPITSSTTSTVTSEFSADDTVVKSGIIVQLPADLDLTYSDALDTFQVKTEVGVYGEISDYMEVKISLPSKLEYTNEDKSATAMGLVRFGDEDDTSSYEIWNASEVYAGKESSDDIDKRSLVVNVPGYNIPDADDYSSDVKFNVTLQVTGSTDDVCAPTTTLAFKIANWNSGLNLYTPYSGTQCSSDSVNLNGISYATSVSENRFEPVAYNNNIAVNCSNVKYIQLAVGSEDYFVSYNADKYTSTSNVDFETAVKQCTSWLFIYHNVQVLIIPEDAKAKQFHVKGITSSITFPDSNVKVGNALCFAKDIDENNQFVYVPHIVYRGTIEQWKALSGEDDWVFGNISNVVTVHCTDGVLYY